MDKRKHDNEWLLNLLKQIIMGGFILLLGSFLLFVVTTRPKEKVPENNVPDQPPLVETFIEEVPEPVIEVLPPERIFIEDDTILEAEETLLEPVSNEDINQASYEKEEDTFTERPIEDEVSTQDLDNPPIPIFSAYKLTLSDYVIQEAGEVILNEDLDVSTLVGQYFANMTFKEKLRLVNMLVSKIKNIDVFYLWDIVADGITLEEVAILQGLIEENFTLEEIDELYGYYIKSELAQME